MPQFRIKNYLRYFKNFALNTFTPRNIPYTSQIELTLQCNAKCPFCSIQSIPNNLLGEDMSTKQVKFIIDQLAELGVNTLTFTGGEPTLREDLPEIIYHTGITHNFINGIATNGYLMPELFKKYSFDGLDYILTSLDYPTAEQHNKIRGIDVFEKVIEMIQIANQRDIKVIISTVVMKDNIDQLDEICELAERLDCSIELFPCENVIREINDTICQITSLKERVPDLHLWALKITELRKKFDNIITDPYSVKLVEQGGLGGYPDFYQDILRCNSAKTLLFISHDGQIKLPCKLHPLLEIDAFKYPLNMIYNTREVREIIHNQDQYSFCNHCRLGCSVAASLTSNLKLLATKFVLNFFKGNFF
ncbi:MAG: radical SAM protein [Promethearchaeia archaeon]